MKGKKIGQKNREKRAGQVGGEKELGRGVDGGRDFRCIPGP